MPILVFCVLALGVLVEGALDGQGSCRTVASEMAFGEELDLLVVAVARDRARGAEAAGDGACEAEIDALANIPTLKGAGVEGVGEGEGGLAHEVSL